MLRRRGTQNIHHASTDAGQGAPTRTRKRRCSGAHTHTHTDTHTRAHATRPPEQPGQTARHPPCSSDSQGVGRRAATALAPARKGDIPPGRSARIASSRPFPRTRAAAGRTLAMRRARTPKNSAARKITEAGAEDGGAQLSKRPPRDRNGPAHEPRYGEPRRVCVPAAGVGDMERCLSSRGCARTHGSAGTSTHGRGSRGCR